ncbi:decarboxylase [Streptomyces sp. NPDC049906]|uniref:aspartate racemase/maleate isomerase family protein n=1 Tax=Streptomyces sp. NPDC049906 TaxID=3155656 RepID=UPI00343E4331
MTSLGFLYPEGAAADDYVRVEQLLGGGIRLHAVRAAPASVDASDPAATAPDGPGPALTALPVPPDGERLAPAVEELRLAGAEALVWAGPGFALGQEGALAQVRALALAAGLPASSTSFAFAHAVRELGVERLAVAPVYGPELTERFARFLTAESGARVVSAPSATGNPAPADGLTALTELARAADVPEATAVLLPGTPLRTAAHLTALEQHLGKPVLTANQVTVWEALRLTDRRVNAPRLGALFTREPLVQMPAD